MKDVSEGPEVKIIADKISGILQGKKIEEIICKNLDSHVKNKIVGSELEILKHLEKILSLNFLQIFSFGII
jgi:formamidopyrimidine-DNA glycosylase